jgi:branched-chain amino acid transport system substrate-binding protein
MMVSGGEEEVDESSNTAVPEPRRSDTGNGTRRRVLVAAVVAVIVIAAALISAMVLKPSPERATIGVIIPLEEGIVSHSEEVRDAVKMAIDELNAWGGIGNTRLQMVFSETASNAEAITEAFEEMESDHNPLFYITISCEFMGVMAPLAEAVSAPLIGMSSYPGATEGYQYTYRYNIPPAVEVASAMSIMEDLNVTSVGLLYTESPHGCTIHEAFSEAFLDAGGSVEDEPCATDEPDFSAQVANLTDNPAIFAVSTCTSLAAMFEAISDSGYEGYVIASSCASSTFMWSLEEADGVYLSAPLMYKQENILARAFMVDFKQTYGIDVTHHGAVSYDVVNLVHGLLEGKEVTRSSLEFELSQGFIFTGVMGSITIEPGEHDFDFNVYPARIVEGELLFL